MFDFVTEAGWYAGYLLLGLTLAAGTLLHLHPPTVRWVYRQNARLLPPCPLSPPEVLVFALAPLVLVAGELLDGRPLAAGVAGLVWAGVVLLAGHAARETWAAGRLFEQLHPETAGPPPATGGVS